MSRHLAPVAACVLAVALAGCWRVPVNAGSPPQTIVSAGCPIDGCQYGTWTAQSVAHLYAEPDGLQLDVDLSPGDVIQATSGEIHSTPRRARVLAANADDNAQDIRRGDIVYALYPMGDGSMALWQNGFMKAASPGLIVEYDPPVPKDEAPLRWTWWVKVRLVDGTIAWLKNPKNFRGMDKLGRQ